MENENQKVSIEFKDNALVAGLDSNQDGEKSIDLKLHLKEALAEAMDKGEAQVDAKVVSVKFELTKLKVMIDTDKDGEPLLELTVDLGDSFDEVSGAIAKK